MSGFSIWIYAKIDVKALGESSHITRAGSTVGIALGTLTAANSLFGLCAAAFRSRYCQILYIAVSFIILCHLATALIYSTFFRYELINQLNQYLRQELTEPEGYEGLLTYANKKFKCCGVETWARCGQGPYRYCITYPNSRRCRKPEPCLPLIWEFYFNHQFDLGSILLLLLSGTSVVSIGAMTLLYYAQLKRADDRYESGITYDSDLSKTPLAAVDNSQQAQKAANFLSALPKSPTPRQFVRTLSRKK